jgi:hypothetical protein
MSLAGEWYSVSQPVALANSSGIPGVGLGLSNLTSINANMYNSGMISDNTATWRVTLADRYTTQATTSKVYFGPDPDISDDYVGNMSSHTANFNGAWSFNITGLSYDYNLINTSMIVTTNGTNGTNDTQTQNYAIVDTTSN